MLEVIGIAGTVLAAAAYLPQIVSLVKSKESLGIDLRSWLVWFVATGCILVRSLAGDDVIFKILSISNFTFVTLTLMLICVYRGILNIRRERFVSLLPRRRK